jgi:hypothetical protein
LIEEFVGKLPRGLLKFFLNNLVPDASKGRICIFLGATATTSVLYGGTFF